MLRLIRFLILALLYGLKGDFRFFYYLKFRKHAYSSRQELLRYQKARLQKYLKYCYEKIPYYRPIFKKAGVGLEFDDPLVSLKKLPILTKADLRLNSESMVNKKLRLIRCDSGGSTGTPVTAFKDRRYNAISRAVSLRNHAVFAGWLPAEKAVWVWGAIHEVGPKKMGFIQRMKWGMNNNIVLNAFSYSEEDFENWIGIIQKNKPTVLYGYASAILDFAKYLRNKNVGIKGIIKKVITTSQALIDRDVIKEVFGACVFDQYGCREILAIAEECRYGTMHISEDFLVLEISDDARVLLTPFESYGMPLIRYDVGDSVEIVQEEACECGSPFKGMRIRIGRHPVSFKDKNGKLIGANCVLLDLVSLGVGIKECQMIQEKIERFRLNIVKDESWRENDRQRIQDYLSRIFPAAEFVYVYVENIPLEPSGKKILAKCLC